MFFILIAVGLADIGWLLHRDGWEPTWNRWSMSSRSPPFSDLRGVTGAMDSMEAGYDPMVDNPGSSWHPVLNHPRIWFYLVAILGIHERDSNFVAPVLLAGLLVGLWWLTRDIGLIAALYSTAIFFSAAFMLAVERGNTDLLIFFLLALAYLVAARSALVATLIILLAFMMKLFPLAAILILLREPKKRALSLGILAVLGVIIYLVVIRDDLPKIWGSTEKGATMSYGYNVLPLYMESHLVAGVEIVRRLFYVLILGGIGFAWWQHRRAPVTEPAPSRSLDGYRIGAAIYAGTYLLGNSWDYRMIFFFFAIPQLFEWLYQGSRLERWMAAGQLLAFLIACWSIWLINCTLIGFWPASILEVFAKGWLFVGSLYFLVHTLPGWARAWLRFDFTSGGVAPTPTR